MNSFIVSYEQLLETCNTKLLEAGVNEEDAFIVSDVLVHANLRGVHSHGVIRLEHYINKIKAGGINPKAEIRIEETGPATAVVDGDDGLGHAIAKNAMDYAVKLSRTNGIGAVGVMNSSHCGALSYFVKQAAEANMIGMAMTNTDKLVVPFGGSKPFFGTNPIAFGFPSGSKRPVLLDMATSTVAYGKILVAREKKESIPPDWAVDDIGQPITNPDEFAALLPFGGAKGYGLAMAIDIFSGILTGSAFGPHVTPMYGDYGEKRKLGHYFMAIDISRFTPIDQFNISMVQMIHELHHVKPSPGFNQVLVPGEPEDRLEEERRKSGIPLTESEYRYLFGEEVH